MKRLWIGAFVICGLAPLAVAQRGGGMGGWGAGRPPVAGGTGAGRFAGSRRGNINRGQFGGTWGFPGWGYSASGYPGGSSDMDLSEPTPMVFMLPVQPPEPPPLPPPPPQPAKPVMHSYSWPDAGAPSAATFLILSKDGAVRQAIAVWVQENQLHYTSANGVAGRVSIGAIDREATVRVNAERGLSFWLPDRP